MRITSFFLFIHIFDFDNENEILYQYPEDPNPTLAPVFLSCSRTDEGLHLDVIVNLETYARKYGISCNYCGANSRNTGTSHPCKTRNHCNICKRPLLQKDNYVDPQILLLYCDKLINPHEESCPKCFLKTGSVHCSGRHSAYFCNAAILCSKCNQRTSLKGYKSKEEAEKSHVCGSSKCNVCFNLYKNVEGSIMKHCCKMKQFQRPKALKNIMVLSMQFRRVPESTNIFSVIPFVASICYEHETKQNFVVETVVDPCLHIPYNIRSEKQQIYLPYFKEHCIQYKSKFLHRAKWLKDDYVTRIMHKGGALQSGTFYDLLVNKLISWQFRSYTVIVETHEGMSVILKALSDRNIQVYIVGAQLSHLNSITVQSLDLSFVCFTKYIDLDLYQCSQTFETQTQKMFLPLPLIEQGKQQYSGPIPELSLFCNSPISINMMDIISKYHCGLFGTFDLGSNIISASQSDCLIMTESIISFINTTFSEQAFLFKELNMPKDDNCFPLFYPFSAKITSVAALYYSIFCFCSKLSEKLVCCPIACMPNYDFTRSSGPEQELAEFYAYKYKQTETLYYASTTKYGQYTFFEDVYPDAYFPDISLCLFYMGCYYHGCVLCKTNTNTEGTTEKKWKGKRAMERYNSTIMKMEKFCSTYSHLKVDIIWGCQYEKMRQEDDELIYFLSCVYQPIPRDVPFTIAESAHPPQTSVFAHRWNSEDNSNEKMYCLDIR